MIIEELAGNVVRTNFEAFDDKTVEQAKRRLIDIVGCIIGGAHAGGCAGLRDLVREWGGQEEATILVHGGKAPAGNVAMINSIMGRSFDYGVITPYIGDKAVWAHIAETNVPTALTMAEWKHASGRELITAMILGDDLTTRIAAGSTHAVSPGWDTPGTVDKFGATAIAAKLMGLDERQLINAFGIVLNQLAGSFQGIQDGAHTFKLAQGLAARDGIIAAELAGKGWAGGRDPLLGKYVYFALYCRDHDPDILTRNLGKEFYGDCTFKPYPCCRFIHSTIDCGLKLVRSHDINTAEIDTITIEVAPMHFDSPLNQPFGINEFPQGGATFSLRYHIANVLIRKTIKLEHMTEEFIRDAEVGNLAGKVSVTGNTPPEMIEAATVTVRMKDGREFRAHEDAATGNPLQKPLGKADIITKFRDNIAFSNTISKDDGEHILTVLENVEMVEDISELVTLCVG
ncbi:MAG: MmgE/PrpD family protein [Dehalococcoidales bacterium]|nr:MmgE/PrpD family protein [Dehalococcoidales bacterium]